MDNVIRRGVLAVAAAAVLAGTTTAAAADSTTTASDAAAAVPPLTATLHLPSGPATVTALLSYHEDGSALGNGRNLFTDLRITRVGGDTTSTFLLGALTSHRILAKGLAVFLAPAGKTQPRMTITLGRPTVASYTVDGDSGKTPEETITFGFTNAAVDVFTPNGKGGFTDSKACFGGPGTSLNSCPAVVH